MHRICALLALCFCGAAWAQPGRLETLDWLSGTWVHVQGESRVTETWVGPAQGVMVGANLAVAPKGAPGYEFMRIAETPRGYSFFASPGGRPAVEFPLKESALQRVVFENRDHPFPQRVLYWREGEALVARIEGTRRGVARHQEWRFQRAER